MKTKIHPPITNAEAFAIGRQLLGKATKTDLELLKHKVKRIKLKRREYGNKFNQDPERRN